MGLLPTSPFFAQVDTSSLEDVSGQTSAEDMVSDDGQSDEEFVDPNDREPLIPQKINSDSSKTNISKSFDSEEKKPLVILKRFEGIVSKSLSSSVRRVTGSAEIARQFMNALVLDINPKSSSLNGTRFSLDVVAPENGKLRKFSRLVRASLGDGGSKIEKFHVEFTNGGAFVSLSDDSDRFLYSPVDYIQVSSPFNLRRRHPIRRRYLPHQGVDLRRTISSNIYATSEGVVAIVSKGRGRGNYVVIQHADGIQTHYQHLASFAPGLDVGQAVSPGTLLGQIGCTGYCTSAHLHFGLSIGGVFVNPAFYMKSYPYWETASIQRFRENPKNHISLR